MKACDNCHSTDAVETVYVQVTSETRTGSRHVELCGACVAKIADTAELTLAEISSRGLGINAVPAPFPFRDAAPPEEPPGGPAETPADTAPPAEPPTPQPENAAVESAAEPAPLVSPPSL